MNNSRNFTNTANSQNTSSTLKDKLKKFTTGVALAGTLMMGTACHKQKNTVVDTQKEKIENVESKTETSVSVSDIKKLGEVTNETSKNVEEDEFSFENMMDDIGMGEELREVQEQEKLRKEYDSLEVVLAEAKRENEAAKRENEAAKRENEEKKANLASKLEEMEGHFSYFSNEQLLAKGDLSENLNLYFNTCKDIGRKPSARALELKKLISTQKVANK